VAVEHADMRLADETWHQHVVRAVPLGAPSDDMLALIQQHVVDPTVLDEHKPFVWSAQVSNTNVDTYFTRMDPSSLKNFEADAQAGISFMNSHRTGGIATDAELPMGRSFDAKFTGASTAGPARVDESFYTLAGLAPNGAGSLTTDQFIANMRSGIGRDVSVGFYGGWYRCSICNANMMRDHACMHWPGFSYPVLDSKGNATGEDQTAIAWIHDAHQAEASLVFDGATPGCMTLKAKRMAETGLLKPEAIDLLEQRYRMRLPHPARSFAGAEIQTPQEGDEMPADPKDGGQAPDQFARIRSILTDAGVVTDETPDATALGVLEVVTAWRSLRDEAECLRPLEAECDRLRPLADEGRQYRADLVEAAIAEGKRAHGAEFAEDTYRGLLTGASIETVKRMRDDWRAIGDRQFPGGRATIEGHEAGVPATQNGAVPAAAYAG
jgi:hypothetical protein